MAKLQFAASWTRTHFDISFVVSELAWFCASVGTPQWPALHHVMEYLKGFPSLKLINRRRVGATRDLCSGIADSYWGNSSSCRSTSGNLMLYNKAPAMWKFKMQQTMALSMAKAEYYAASTVGSEVLYLRKLLRVRPSVAHACPRRQHGVHRVG